MSKEKVYETSFDETEFIAVTAYQNEEVCLLFVFIDFLLINLFLFYRLKH